MSTALVIAIVIAAVVIGLIALFALRHYMQERARRRERVAADAAGHRREADANTAKARDLNERLAGSREEAERHRELAERHAARAGEAEREAGELEEQIPRAGRSADFHDQRAAELEEKL